MEKDNKYYGIIENLIRNHKKFNGYDAILDDIIDDVCKHSESVINTVNDENVVISYLQKIVSVSVITVPKRLGLHTEIKHRSITNVIPSEKQEEKPLDTLANDDFIQPVEEVKTSTVTEKANVELVDKMINSIDSASITETTAETANNSDTNIFTEEETEILDSDVEVEQIDEADVFDILTDNSEQTDEAIKPFEAASDEYSGSNIENLEPVEELETFEPQEAEEAESIFENNAENLEPVEELETFEPQEAEEAESIFENNAENLEPVEELETFEPEEAEETESIFEDNAENLEPVEELETFEPEEAEETESIFEDKTENLEPVEELETFEPEEAEEAESIFEDNAENLEPIEELEAFAPETENLFEEETLEPVEETDLAEMEPATFDFEAVDTLSPEEDIITESDSLEVDFNNDEINREEDGLSVFSEIEEEDSGLIDINNSFDLNEEISLVPTHEVASEEESIEEKDEPSYKQVDYSLFNYAPEVHTDTDKIKNIEMKLSDLNNQKPELNILKIFDLKYKQNLPITQIAEELNIRKQDVISALDEIIELI